MEGNPADLGEAVDAGLDRPQRIYSNPDLIAFDAAHPSEPTQILPDYLPRDVVEAARENSELESELLNLWKARLASSSQKVRESLVFSKMMVASPGMRKTVREILRASSSASPRKRNDDPFPSVLVVGSPGAGKEKVAQLIALFNPHYWDAKRASLNMAGINNIDTLEEKLNVEAGLDNTAVVFLDELNSLDVATQGAMLRILELGQFSSLPVVAPHVTDWLIIGLINEDPAQLTLGEIRERTRDTFVFGHLFGALLYEHFKTRSRMRDDLYYRMRRCGEIRVDDLNDRREDIPIILYFLVSRTSKEFDIHLTYDALKELVATDINWKGNVRQLELVAREIVTLLQKDKPEQIRSVLSQDVRLALTRARVPRATS